MFLDWLKSDFVSLILIITFGLIIGKIKIKGISLELSGVLFSGLIFGHLGFAVPDTFLSLGLVLFVFSIGMQAGPGFFDAFKKNGRKFLFLAVIIISFTALFAYLLKIITKTDAALNAGIFAGALTSSPGLAAASEATDSNNVPIAYGIAYPIGLVGVILTVNIIPKLLKINISDEEKKYYKSLKEDFPEISGKTFQILNPNIEAKTINEVNLRKITNCSASRILHKNTSLTPTGDTVLHKDDLIRLVGTEDALKRAEILFGKPVNKQIPLSGKYDIRWLVVTNKKIINKSYQNINISAFNTSIVKLRRSGVDLTPTPGTLFKFGDKLLIAGTKNGVNKAAKLIGDNKKLLSETDLLPIFLGVLIGILLGKIQIPFFDLFNFSLGKTGGALIAGLFLSKIGKTGPILWTMSSSANQLLRNVGLILFMAVVGSKAGVNFVATMQLQGLNIILMSFVVTFIPIILGIILARCFFKINFLTVLGLITGIMTSTPGLGVVQSKSECNAGPVAYATVYPFALVLVIIFSQLLVMI